MKRFRVGVCYLVCMLVCAGIAHTGAARQEVRVTRGLIALYDFRSTDGAIVKDRSGVGKPLDLNIADPKAVRRAKGALEVRGKTLIRSDKAASKITNAVRKSGEITIEAWIRTANGNQRGPARIVTLSRNTGERSFTLGQEGTRVEVRFRTAKTSANGIPSLNTPDGVLQRRLTHVVYTRDRKGRARIFINGKPSRERAVAGPTSSWDGSFRLALANELTNDRPWRGTFYLVALYDRDLTHEHIEQNYRAGAGREAARALLADRKAAPEVKASTTGELSAKYFKAHIAPLLAKHCLECHGWKAKKGKLDLSRKETALKGGSSGKAIVPGKSAKSLMWESVESDEMPRKRPPLSRQEKQLLKTWIDAGAIWSGGVIEKPALAHDRRAGSTWLRRLTVAEYIETVRVAVGVDVAEDARKILPRDLRADGFSNTAYNLTVDLGHVEAYARLAEKIVERVDVGKFAGQYGKSRELTDASMRRVVSGMGKWLLRGPLEEHEVASFLRISKAVAKEGGDFDEAVTYILRAMLQSPRFIYRMENQRGDGTTRRVSDYELAARLSYILWGAPPDKELMSAADAGKLSDRGGVAAQVRRMLQDPRAVERSARFIYEWLDLARLDYLRPNKEKFPKWDARLAADMRAETLAFFKDVAWKQNRPLADLLNAQVTYATPRLAKHYGLKPKGEGLQRYDLSSVDARGGLLTQGSVLTAGGDDASMVTRGLFVLHDILRGTVKDPPPGVDTTPVPSKPGLSNRVISEKRIVNPSCGGCHGKFEPFAFGLEKFDGVGGYHEVDEHGNKLRDDGELIFPGNDRKVPYKSSSELMNLLARSDRVSECITWKATQFALGRPLVEADAPFVDKIHQAARKGGGTYAGLITAIVMSDLVQLTRTEAAR